MSSRVDSAAAPPAPLPHGRAAEGEPSGAQRSSAHGAPARRAALTLSSFGFKYGPPAANHVFDVSFLKNPARQEGWSLWSKPGPEMRNWVTAQPEAQAFLEAILPLARFLAKTDDDVRIAFGCSAGRHRSAILVEEVAQRLRAEGVELHVHHREKERS